MKFLKKMNLCSSFKRWKYRRFDNNLNFFNSWYINSFGNKVYRIDRVGSNSNMYMYEYDMYNNTDLKYIGHNCCFTFDSFMSEHTQITSLYLFDTILKEYLNEISATLLSNYDKEYFATKENYIKFRLDSNIMFDTESKRFIIKVSNNEYKESLKLFKITKKQLKKYFL